jgi:hypothetical protein
LSNFLWLVLRRAYGMTSLNRLLQKLAIIKKNIPRFN